MTDVFFRYIAIVLTLCPQTGSFDPEGLLGCLTSIFLCYLGVHAGRLFVATRKLTSPLVLYAHLIVWGITCGVIGTVTILPHLHEASRTSHLRVLWHSTHRRWLMAR